MDLIIDLVENESSYFEEAVEKPIWVEVMVEEYHYIVKNCILEVVPRPKDKLDLQGKACNIQKHRGVQGHIVCQGILSS